MANPTLVTQGSSDPASLPAWLDQQELQSLLKQEMAGFRSIQSIRGKWEMNLVQPTFSVQLQVECAGNRKRVVSYLVKSSEKTPSGRQFPIEGDFSVELRMYEDILPALEDLYKDAGQAIKFTPPFLSTKQGSSFHCLFLDYAQTRGYSVANTLNGLESPAMEAVLSKLAAYHAATARYIQTNSDKKRVLPKLVEGAAAAAAAAGELKSLLQLRFHESLRSHDAREYEDKVKAFQKYVRGAIDHSDTRNSFNVILIGACFPNNILNNTDAFGNVKDSLFVDFHAAKYGPAVYDLFSLLLTAPAKKCTRFDGFVKYYHDRLTANLTLLKYRGKQPTLTDLYLDLLKYGHWAFEVATEILPIVLSHFDSDDADIVELVRSPLFSLQIRELLPWLENRGYFEEE
ncbi:uncharacterized protein LOC117896922 [Drosophila subobscura]|uniref:uncharacterized protein LOC117896922 n=1 Tax=Drosophila subobscura TaxID=7241 RepID=UPI00155A27CB|nr:uncharacterized protein LOC117896922 [Drosophila subobscura]